MRVVPEGTTPDTGTCADTHDHDRIARRTDTPRKADALRHALLFILISLNPPRVKDGPIRGRVRIRSIPRCPDGKPPRVNKGAPREADPAHAGSVEGQAGGALRIGRLDDRAAAQVGAVLRVPGSGVGH